MPKPQLKLTELRLKKPIQLEFAFMPLVKRLEKYRQRVGELKPETVKKLKELLDAHLSRGPVFRKYPPVEANALVQKFLDQDMHKLLFSLQIKPEDVKKFNAYAHDAEFHPKITSGGAISRPLLWPGHKYPSGEYCVLKYFRPKTRKGEYVDVSSAERLLLNEFKKFLESQKKATLKNLKNEVLEKGRR